MRPDVLDVDGRKVQFGDVVVGQIRRWSLQARCQDSYGASKAGIAQRGVAVAARNSDADTEVCTWRECGRIKQAVSRTYGLRVRRSVGPTHAVARVDID